LFILILSSLTGAIIGLIYLVVNKSDGINEQAACSDFLSLGFKDVFPVSAAHGRGVNSLLSDAMTNYIEVEPLPEVENAIKIAFVGRPNVGKSTLINRMLGEERVVVYDMPGTTRDSIAIPFSREEKHYILIDTAGIRRRARINEKIEKFSVIKTIQSVKASDVCVMLVDAKEGITDQDLNLLGIIIESGKALVITVNKWDGLEEEQKLKVKDDIQRKLYFSKFAKLRYISALHGSGVGLLFNDIEQAYASASQSFSTSFLTRLLQDIVSQHVPPMVKGRRIKLRYAHSGGQNPPIIVIHGNQLEALPDSYKRYLINAFSEQLKLTGTPLKLEFKTGINPYKNKRNKLTPRQQHKKKRLMRRVKK
jgi:GTP-binding protein